MHIIFDDAEFKAMLVGVARLESSVNTLQSTVATLQKRSDMAFQDLMKSVGELGDTLVKIDDDVTKLKGAVATLQATVDAIPKDNMTKEQWDALQAAVDGVRVQAQAIDDRTPDAPPAPTV